MGGGVDVEGGVCVGGAERRRVGRGQLLREAVAPVESVAMFTTVTGGEEEEERRGRAGRALCLNSPLQWLSLC